MNTLDGILLIDKPKGWSSFDVVGKVRGVLRTEIRKQKLGNSEAQLITNSKLLIPKVKVGHTGTLDPLATGLMIVVVGSYCKRASEFSNLSKVYDVTMKLGETSTTGDEEGLKQKVASTKPSKIEVVTALDSFLGETMQTPPIYSAIKIDGKRAYKLAREGKEVVIKPRKVSIKSLELTEYKYPYVRFMADVGSGTYIRSLVEDIGKYLETGAYMSDLRRMSVGAYEVGDARSPESVTASDIVLL